LPQRAPDVVLVAHSVDSFGYAAALAARLGLGFATDVFDARRASTANSSPRAAAMDRRSMSKWTFPGRSTVLLAIRGNVFKPRNQPASPKVTAFGAPAEQSRSRAASSSN
jgi:electron transfer flavoprotein alpha subunit